MCVKKVSKNSPQSCCTMNIQKYRLFTHYAGQCLGQVRDKQGHTGTSRNMQGQGRGRQGQGRDRQGQTRTSKASSYLSLLVPVCPCLSLPVPVCPCLSILNHACPCQILPPHVPACPFLVPGLVMYNW